MSPAQTEKDPSKMSRTQLLRLYNATATEKTELATKYGKVHKRYKHAKKVLAASKDPKELMQRTKIPYPTGETPSRGDFNLGDFLLTHSEVSKEDYNAFLEAIHKSLAAASIRTTSLWRDVPMSPLSEVLDIIHDQYPWLAEYENDWPATSTVKQFLKNSRNNSSRKRRKAATRAAVATTAAAAVN